MTQNTADPAPANQNKGNEHKPTAAYCCAKLSSRPVKKDAYSKLHTCNIITYNFFVGFYIASTL